MQANWLFWCGANYCQVTPAPRALASCFELVADELPRLSRLHRFVLRGSFELREVVVYRIGGCHSNRIWFFKTFQWVELGGWVRKSFQCQPSQQRAMKLRLGSHRLSGCQMTIVPIPTTLAQNSRSVGTASDFFNIVPMSIELEWLRWSN